MDFRCLFANQYDESILTDKLILSRGKWWPKKRNILLRNSTMTSDLFIIGDSFSKYKPDSIYLNLLASDFNIKNFSKNGLDTIYHRIFTKFKY